MIKNIKVNNFKSFCDADFDLMLGKDPNPRIFIYGENGVGKSNFVDIFNFVKHSTGTLTSFYNMQKIVSSISKERPRTDSLYSELFEGINSDMEQLIIKNKTNGHPGNMTIRIDFVIGGDNNGYYEIETNNQEMIKETLYGKINQRTGLLYSISKDAGVNLGSAVIKKSIYAKELVEKIDQYWGKHTFLSILDFELSNKNATYLTETLNNNMMDILYFFRNLNILSPDTMLDYKYNGGNKIGGYNIFSGKLPVEEEGIEKKKEELEIIRMFIENILKALYIDIKMVYYKYDYSDKRFCYDLFLKKLVGEKVIDIKYNNESTGTKKIIKLLPSFYNLSLGKTVVIDEIDEGIHDLMMRNILESINKSKNGQLITNTHNTLLMDSMPKNMIYILDVDDKGNKELLPITAYGERIQKNHSVRSKYLKGHYKGIPYSVNFELEEVAHETMHAFEERESADEE